MVKCYRALQCSLSAAVLQGFQCIPASDLPAADILAVTQGLQNRTAELSSAQVGRNRGCKPHRAQRATGSREVPGHCTLALS